MLKIVDSVAVAAKDTERRARGVVLVRIPEDVDLLERRASDRVPVSLSIGDRGNSRAVVGAGNRPASLGDPDPLARRNGVDLVASGGDGVPEGGGGVADGCVLEVGCMIMLADKARECSIM